jgi:hypothetical protein
MTFHDLLPLPATTPPKGLVYCLNLFTHHKFLDRCHTCTHSPLKMEQTKCSEMLAISTLRRTTQKKTSHTMTDQPVYKVAWIAQSGLQLATGWTIQGSNPNGGKIFHTRPDWSWGPTRLLHHGCWVFPVGKAARV